MRKVLTAILFFWFTPSVLAQNSFDLVISGGATRGVSLTDTRSRPASEAGIDFFPPVLGKRLGISYLFIYRHPRYGVARPFSMERTEAMHLAGLTVRLAGADKRFQPWLSGGAMFYRDRIKISLYDEILLEARKTKTVVAASAGLNIFLWKGLLIMPEARLAGIARPFWQVGGRIGWQFGKRGR